MNIDPSEKEKFNKIAEEWWDPNGKFAPLHIINPLRSNYVSEKVCAGMIGVNIGVPVPREPFSFGGWNDSRFGVGDITGKSSINFWTQLKKRTTKWNKGAKKNWMS